jgi:hypothetical protein
MAEPLADKSYEVLASEVLFLNQRAPVYGSACTIRAWDGKTLPAPRAQ